MRGSFKQLDQTIWITPDGITYPLDRPNKGWVLSDDGWGMPPIEYVTQRGPFQHGESVRAVFLRPRTIQVIIRQQGCSRSEYWSLRNNLLDMLRPARAGTTPGTLRKIMAGGEIRDFDAYASQGPAFPGRQPGVWDEWSIQDTIRFTCFNPIATKPTLYSLAFVSASSSVFTFPVTFPVTFGAFGGAGAAVSNGTWETYPVLILNGPLTSPTIQNLTTDEKFQLNTTVSAGQVVTVDFAYGKKSVTRNDGTNLMGFVSSDSDLGTFHLDPGSNQFQAVASGATVASSMVLEWYDKYVGI